MKEKKLTVQVLNWLLLFYKASSKFICLSLFESIPEHDENRVYNHEKVRDPVRTPVHVHIHDDSSSEKTTNSKKDSGKKSVDKAETSNSDESVETNGGDAAIVSGGN